MNRCSGRTIIRSAPSPRMAPSIAVTIAMMRKIGSSSRAATIPALNTAAIPVVTLPL